MVRPGPPDAVRKWSHQYTYVISLLQQAGQISTPSYVIHSVMLPHQGVVMSCCDLGMTRRYNKENFLTIACK